MPNFRSTMKPLFYRSPAGNLGVRGRVDADPQLLVAVVDPPREVERGLEQVAARLEARRRVMRELGQAGNVGRLEQELQRLERRIAEVRHPLARRLPARRARAAFGPYASFLHARAH